MKTKNTAAPRNRTLFLEEFEKDELKNRLVNNLDTTKPIKQGFFWGDTFEFLEKIEKKSVNLLIVDPPYNLHKQYAQSTFKEMLDDEYQSFTSTWIEKCLPTLKPNASIYVCSDWKTSILLAPLLSHYFKIRNRITWERDKGRGSSKNWKNNHEDIWFCTLSEDYQFDVEAVKLKKKVIATYQSNGEPKGWTAEENGNFRWTAPSNLWKNITVPFWSMPENTPHPTQKPEKLIAKLLMASSKKGDLVLDPFAGSGTTAVVSEKLERRWIAIERELDYCLLALKRLDLAQKDKKIQGLENGFFLDRLGM